MWKRGGYRRNTGSPPFLETGQVQMNLCLPVSLPEAGALARTQAQQ